MDWYGVGDQAAQERLLAAWPDAPASNTELAGMLLDIAREQVLDYAGVEPPAANAVPVRYVYSQLQQSVNLWNAGRASSDGTVGAEGYQYTPRPLDKTIRTIIRPQAGVPNVF